MAVLARAIRERRVVAFLYNGRERTVEPQCLGIGTRGTSLLRGHQLEGGEVGEPLFDVTKMRGLALLGRTFDRPGPGYQRDDSGMVEIVEQLQSPAPGRRSGREVVPRRAPGRESSRIATMAFLLEVARSIRRTFRRPLPSFIGYHALFDGQTGLEIGGPSELFRRVLPIYAKATRVDGVNFSAETVWEGRLVAGETYRSMAGKVGRQYICEASDLSEIPSEAYDFVLSSNSLEHIANPLKALHEWQRVLRIGGHLVLVLPRSSTNFDHRREVTALAHLIDDFRADVTEHDLTHLPEILERHDYARDPPSVDRAFMKKRALSNFENRCLHHHVFDPGLMRSILEFVGFQEVMQTETAIDYVAVAQKVSHTSRGH